MTLGEACLEAKRRGDTDVCRRVFAQAIRRGVTYRALAKHVKLSHGYLHYLVAGEDTVRSDVLAERYWEHE